MVKNKKKGRWCSYCKKYHKGLFSPKLCKIFDTEKEKTSDFLVCEKCGRALEDLDAVARHSQEFKHYEYKTTKDKKLRLMLA